MAGVGGYQRPTNPAPVSGPGKFSQRTDGGPSVDNAKQAARYISGGAYGEGKELENLQTSAPMSAAPSMPTRPVFDVNSLPPLPEGIVPLSEPTKRPDEPITAGVPFGEGINAPSRINPLVNNFDENEDAVAKVIRATYAQYPSPVLGRLIQRLDEEGR